ncbi:MULTISPECIES: hypothetical protein [Marinobacter]|uniref:hypothetical protein n=1 Tax=Marinobacter sp. TaxID=50741 RepID=UPI002942F517|nr:hypothetical protein [Marinobacter salarius]WOI19646.1 hypothetical protein R1T46_01905 [Marinobacter salarius]
MGQVLERVRMLVGGVLRWVAVVFVLGVMGRLGRVMRWFGVLGQLGFGEQWPQIDEQHG